MTGGSGDARIVTPEGVALRLETAGIGSRMIAAIIDTLIQAAVGLAVALSWMGAGGGRAPGAVPITAAILFFFVLVWGYYPLFEGLWNGRTPGKRAQHLRVVQSDGRPVTWGAVIVRNLVRIVDFLPAYYAFGAITMLLSRRSQRLGDLAAGTVVVHEAPVPVPSSVLGGDVAGPLLDTAGLAERDYDVVRSFLERRDSLSQDARAALAARLADLLRARLSGEAAQGLGDEAFVEAVARSYRARFR